MDRRKQTMIPFIWSSQTGKLNKQKGKNMTIITDDHHQAVSNIATVKPICPVSIPRRVVQSGAHFASFIT